MASASALAKAFGLSAGSPASAPVHVRDHAPDGVFAEPRAAVTNRSRLPYILPVVSRYIVT